MQRRPTRRASDSSSRSADTELACVRQARLQNLLNETGPPVQGVVPAREVVWVHGGSITERNGQARGEGGLACAAVAVDGDHANVHRLRRCLARDAVFDGKQIEPTRNAAHTTTLPEQERVSERLLAGPCPAHDRRAS